MKTIFFLTILLVIATFAVAFQNQDKNIREKQGEKNVLSEGVNIFNTATFAGGCFWCTEADFEKVEGVVEVISGYTGGHKENRSFAKFHGPCL